MRAYEKRKLVSKHRLLAFDLELLILKIDQGTSQRRRIVDLSTALDQLFLDLHLLLNVGLGIGLECQTHLACRQRVVQFQGRKSRLEAGLGFQFPGQTVPEQLLLLKRFLRQQGPFGWDRPSIPCLCQGLALSAPGKCSLCQVPRARFGELGLGVPKANPTAQK